MHKSLSDVKQRANNEKPRAKQERNQRDFINLMVLLYNLKRGGIMDTEQYKTCNKCNVNKPLSDYELRADTGKYRNTCKECRKKYVNEWHKQNIDHITPLATATTEQDIIKLCNYKNLQLLKEQDNLLKGDKLDYQIKDTNN